MFSFCMVARMQSAKVQLRQLLFSAFFLFLARASVRIFNRGYEDRYRPLDSGPLVKNCIACFFIDQDINNTTTMLKFTNKVTLATGLY